MRQLLLELIPDAPPSLDNFVVGTNAEALTGLANWLTPESREMSFFLWGAHGAGKTHLALACGASYWNAIDVPDLADIEPALDRRGDGEPPFFAVDNVEALSAAGQIALFNTFNRLRARGGKLLTTAGAPPSQLGLREDLRTRLGSGQIVQMHPLTDEQMIEAIRAHAAERKLPLPIEAINYLLARAPRDMRSVMALLVALDRYSLEHKRAITLPLLREILHAPTAPAI